MRELVGALGHPGYRFSKEVPREGRSALDVRNRVGQVRTVAEETTLRLLISTGRLHRRGGGEWLLATGRRKHAPGTSYKWPVS